MFARPGEHAGAGHCWKPGEGTAGGLQGAFPSCRTPVQHRPTQASVCFGRAASAQGPSVSRPELLSRLPLPRRALPTLTVSLLLTLPDRPSLCLFHSAPLQGGASQAQSGLPGRHSPAVVQEPSLPSSVPIRVGRPLESFFSSISDIAHCHPDLWSLNECMQADRAALGCRDRRGN